MLKVMHYKLFFCIIFFSHSIFAMEIPVVPVEPLEKMSLDDVMSEALDIAVRSKDRDMLVELLKAAEDIGPDFLKKTVNSINSYKNSPLYSAVYLQDYNIVKILLHFGADANLYNSYFGTILHFAVRDGETSIVMLLTERESTNIDAVDSFGNTALHIAARNGQYEMVNILMALGAKVRLNDERLTPLDGAHSNGHKNIEYLIARYIEKRAKRIKAGSSKEKINESIIESVILKHFRNSIKNIRAED